MSHARAAEGLADTLTAVARQWPTPAANEYPQSPEVYETRRRLQEKHHNGNGAGRILSVEAQRWPTASASDGKGSSQIGQRKGQLSEAILWATATATDAKASGAAYAATATRAAGVTLTDQTCRGLLAPLTEPGGKPTSTNGLRLSPLFVEALMGWPIGHSDCGSSATESSPTKRSSPGESSGSDSMREVAR